MKQDFIKIDLKLHFIKYTYNSHNKNNKIIFYDSNVQYQTTLNVIILIYYFPGI